MDGSIWRRIAAFSGIAFAVLLVAGSLLTSGTLPDGDSPRVAEFYADGANRAKLIIGAYLLAVAGLAFLAFLSYLAGRIRSAEGDRPRLSVAVFGAGLVFVAMLFAAAACFASIAADISLGGEAQPPAELSGYLPELGLVFLALFGMFAAAFAIGCTSWATLRAGILPRWTAWPGFVAAVVLLFGVMFLPIVALPVWVVIVSIVLLRDSEPV